MARHGDVVARREVRQQVEFLEDESHGALAQVGAAGVGERGEILIADADAARGGRSQTADDVEQRRLAGARRPDDGEELAAFDVEIDAAQGGHVHLARRGRPCAGRGCAMMCVRYS